MASHSPITTRAIAYVEDLNQFQTDGRSGWARAAGVTGLAIKLHDANGNPLADANARALESGAGRRLTTQGFSVGGWFCPRSQPEIGAARASDLYAQLGLAFAVFETEIEYKDGHVDARRLWSMWRTKRPRAYTFAAVQANMPSGYNWQSTLEADVHLLPENYYGQDGIYDIAVTLERADAIGYPLSKIHPTLSAGQFGETVAESAARAYSANAAHVTRAGGRTIGVALWRGDLWTQADYRLLGILRELYER